MSGRRILAILKAVREARSRQLVVAISLAVVVGFVALILVSYGTGFGPYRSTTTSNRYPSGEVADTTETHPGKTLWDWMDLLLVPLILALGGFWFSQQERKTERQIATDRRREDALQNYLDKMTELLIDKKLLTSEREEKRDIATARTLTVLPGLDGGRKGLLVRFLNESDLITTKTAKVNLYGADLSGAHLTETLLRGAHLRGANLSGAHLRKADLRGADLRGADLRRADLGGAGLRDADLRGTKLIAANLSGADLIGAHLIRADLSGAHLAETFLRRADLSGTDLRGAHLNGAYLHVVNLSGADLSGAHLNEADLREADLSGTDLQGANLSGTNLNGTNLNEADLREADLSGASLKEAKYADKTRWPDGFDPVAAGAELVSD